MVTWVPSKNFGIPKYYSIGISEQESSAPVPPLAFSKGNNLLKRTSVVSWGLHSSCLESFSLWAEKPRRSPDVGDLALQLTRHQGRGTDTWAVSPVPWPRVGTCNSTSWVLYPVSLCDLAQCCCSSVMMSDLCAAASSPTWIGDVHPCLWADGIPVAQGD